MHSNVKITIRVRKEIQNSKENNRALTKKYHLNLKTIAKWKKRNNQEDVKSGTNKVRSVLTDLEQEVICKL